MIVYVPLLAVFVMPIVYACVDLIIIGSMFHFSHRMCVHLHVWFGVVIIAA